MRATIDRPASLAALPPTLTIPEAARLLVPTAKLFDMLGWPLDDIPATV